MSMTTLDRALGVKRNGSPPPAELPEERQKTVEAGIAMYQRTAAECDRLREELNHANHTVTQQRVEVESLQKMVTLMESRVNEAVIHRDQAMADRAKWEGLFVSIMSMMRAFNVPNEPLVREMLQELDRTAG